MQRAVGYTDMETGEYIEKKSYVDKFFDDEAGYIAWTNRKSIKTYIGQPLPDAFNWAEKGRIEALKHYILKDNQFLVYRQNRVIKPMGTEQISEILGLSERRSKIFIRKLKQYHIIKEVKFGGYNYYSFNPLYGLKERRITLTLFLIFQEELADELPKWVVTKFLEHAEELKPAITIIK